MEKSNLSSCIILLQVLLVNHSLLKTPLLSRKETPEAVNPSARVPP
jgi:hypothetical protein